MRQPYPTDLAGHQWEAYGTLLPEAKPGGRPRMVDLREIMNAIFYGRTRHPGHSQFTRHHQDHYPSTSF